MSSTKQDVLGPQTVWVSPSSPAILVKQHKVLYGWVKWNVDEKVWWLINTADHITTLIVLKQLSQSQWGLTETAQQKTSRLFQKITMLSVWCRAARCEHTAAQICSQRQRGGVLQIIATKIIQSDIKKNVCWSCLHDRINLSLFQSYRNTSPLLHWISEENFIACLHSEQRLLSLSVRKAV